MISSFIYWMAKGFQAFGLVLIGVEFLGRFPQIMNMKVLAVGVMAFTAGLGIERYGVRP
jgi:hypothetical protein